MNAKIQKQKVSKLTLLIKANYKRSVEALIEIGRCLYELKTILKRDEFLVHLETKLSMSEMHANRLINLHLKFHNKKSIQVLTARPSVLYLIASSLELKKVTVLAKGGKILVGGKYKNLSQLTIKDIHSIKEKKLSEPKAFDVDEEERDFDRAQNAHRRFSTLCEEISDWANDLTRYKKNKIEIENKDMLKKYLEETIKCLEQLKPLLM